ncbi:uncharacterized protein (TIGR03790 family) [Haloferula luteola]|uniref:Uncharacterized protein (TIGR03790 family) n=1 Tax=Haloferula luteola TaxID=595692 RepID=A0A840V7D4_9BACT|nr:TIGR03790 family protein [Haloferula luteola]MBB5353623.1 uncharacterized protein (TIGR03790 family) [Haloferula luteola]
MLRHLIAFFCSAASVFGALNPDQVVILFNRNAADSDTLAKHYAELRDIPATQIVGLDLPDKEQIDRDEYRTQLRDPLAKIFDDRRWWLRNDGPDGKKQLSGLKVRLIVCMRGVPSRIFHNDTQADPEQDAKDPQASLRRMMMTSSAAVDSELMLLGLENPKTEGPLDNPYFKSTTPIEKAAIPILLVGRIDGPSPEICTRMMDDAVATEKTGLWGFGVVDIANKSAAQDPSGDPWFRTAAKDLREKGFPVLVDRFHPTLPRNFPLPPTALYYGWYDWNVSGPFINPHFHFKRGAIAIHLHSFSAAQLRDAGKNWCAPLLARGAAATVGNTFEPFLHLTHHLDLLNARLLDGFTLIEAATMAMPVVSWQGVVLGDPLYRPFAHLDGTGAKEDDDRVFRALRIAQLRWPDDDLRRRELQKAATRMNNGTMTEALALDFAEGIDANVAVTLLTDATRQYSAPTDQLRTELLKIKLDRERGQLAAAKQGLRAALSRYSQLPEKDAAQVWLDTLEADATRTK